VPSLQGRPHECDECKTSLNNLLFDSLFLVACFAIKKGNHFHFLDLRKESVDSFLTEEPTK
jgi:hypothetical protein